MASQWFAVELNCVIRSLKTSALSMGSKTSKCCYDTVVQEDEETKEPNKLELICEAKEVSIAELISLQLATT